MFYIPGSIGWETLSTLMLFVVTSEWPCHWCRSSQQVPPPSRNRGLTLSCRTVVRLAGLMTSELPWWKWSFFPFPKDLYIFSITTKIYLIFLFLFIYLFLLLSSFNYYIRLMLIIVLVELFSPTIDDKPRLRHIRQFLQDLIQWQNLNTHLTIRFTFGVLFYWSHTLSHWISKAINTLPRTH